MGAVFNSETEAIRRAHASCAQSSASVQSLVTLIRVATILGYDSAATAVTAVAALVVLWALVTGSLFEVGERTLHAMEKRHLEIDAAAQIAQQIRHRRAAGLVEHPAHGPRARRIRELCLRAVET